MPTVSRFLFMVRANVAVHFTVFFFQLQDSVAGLVSLQVLELVILYFPGSSPGGFEYPTSIFVNLMCASLFVQSGNILQLLPY